MIDQQDQDVYDEVGAAFADIRLGRDADAVIRRGRTLRRRRQARPALAIAGVLAVSLGVATMTAQSHSSSRTALVNVDEAAFSVHTDASSGVVTITIRELADENRLKSVLADAGVPAVFHEERIPEDIMDIRFCTWTGASVIDPGKVLTHQSAGADAVFTIVPSAMPRGSVLAFNFATHTAAGHVTSAALLSNTPTGCVD
ncbi:MAG TPA: hypothetical protein VL551_05880 [Actinospica sp.]|jgi:hypothetical protein|nr:hypothetical protein [Actinospica sp.]